MSGWSECPYCTTPSLILGRFGWRIYWRCRGCGLEWGETLEIDVIEVEGMDA